MQEELLDKIRKYLHSDENILFAYIFGSYAKGKQRESSDIDVAVYLEDILETQYFEYKMQIKLELERITKKEIDAVIINNANTLLKYQIFKYGKMIKCKDDKVATNLKIRSLYEYMDYESFARIVTEASKKRIREEVSDGR